MREIDKIYFNTTKKSFNRSREKSEKKIISSKNSVSYLFTGREIYNL